MIQRRTALQVLAAEVLASGVHAGHSQTPSRIYRVGALGISPPDEAGKPVWPPWKVFVDELASRGYVEGRNLVLLRRYADGDPGRLAPLATELVKLNVDVIFTHAGFIGAAAARQATTTVPIVVELMGDPVGRGLVTSLSRPGGNITGNAFFPIELGAKRVQLLLDTLARPSHIAFLRHRADRAEPSAAAVYEDAMAVPARAAGAQLQIVDVDRVDELHVKALHLSAGFSDKAQVFRAAPDRKPAKAVKPVQRRALDTGFTGFTAFQRPHSERSRSLAQLHRTSRRARGQHHQAWFLQELFRGEETVVHIVDGEDVDRFGRDARRGRG